MRKEFWYVLTNKRAMILQNGPAGRSCSSVYFDALPMVDKRVRRDGMGDISFGGPVTGEWRDKHSPPKSPTFDDVDDAESVYRIAICLYEKAHKSGAHP